MPRERMTYRGLAAIAAAWIALSPIESLADTAAGWTRCASENETCTFSGTRRITYGASLNAQNAVGTFSGSVTCNNALFPDPAPGVVKSCWVEDVAQAPAEADVRSPPAASRASRETPSSPQLASPQPSSPPPPSLPLTPATAGQVTARLSATRLSGVAPLAVQFDAIESTAENVSLPFHQLNYDFDFGDDRGLTWAVSGRPKNTQSGAPLAAHVFDNPGRYTVRVRVSNPETGLYADASVTVEVKDPDVAFAGQNTICVSGAGNFAGCPEGAARADSPPRTYGGKRVLLRRGEKFHAIFLRGIDDNVMVSTFGTGDKPVVDRVTLGGNNNFAAWPDDVVIMDLNVIGGFTVAITGSRILLYRCDMTEPNREKVDIGTALLYYVQRTQLKREIYYWPREIFLVENVVIGDTNGDNRPHLVFQGYLMKSALLGNTFNKATEHTLRVWAGYKAVIAHNAIGGEHYAPQPPGIRAALKFHSAGFAPYDDNVGVSGSEIASRYMVTADNHFGSPDYLGSWTVAFMPQNQVHGTGEGLEDLIMERDVFLRGPFTSLDIRNVVRRATIRNETVAGGLPLRMHQVLPEQWEGDRRVRDWTGPYFGMPNNY